MILAANTNVPATRTPRIVIVDGQYSLMRAVHQPNYRTLETKTGFKSGAIFGFCRILEAIQNACAGSSVIVAFDKGHSARRLAVYPDYKKKDHNDEVKPDIGMTDYDYIRMSKQWVLKLLNCLGIPVCELPGREGDDVIFTVSHMLQNCEKILVTDDQDYYSLVTEDTSIYRALNKEFVTLDEFEEKTEMKTPKHFLWKKIMIGDPSDKIPSPCKGVGVKTITPLINAIPEDELSVDRIIEEAGRSTAKLAKRLLTADKNAIKRNFDLVDMSKEQFTIAEIMELEDWMSNPPEQNIQDAMKIMKYLDFGDATIAGVLNLARQSRAFPLKPFINSSYLDNVIREGEHSALY